MSIKVAFVSLGCPKNQIDSEVMLAKLNDAGMEIVADDIDADVVVVNTCAFIESAKAEAIENILDVAWLKKHRNLKGIVAAGCLVQRYSETLFEELPELDAAVGVGSLDSIVEAVRSAYERGNVGKKKKRFMSVLPPETQALGGERVVTGEGFSTYIKISEGCDNHCTYCAIPAIRGSFRSRTVEDIVREAKELVSLGTKELIVVSQDTTRYGTDLYEKPSLDVLLSELCKIDGLSWIRILYCYPDEITDELIDVIAREEKIVKYIDMPLQHVSDKILKLMNRRGDGALVRRTVKKLRERIPGLVLRTTFIVGFPGETEEEFSELYEFVKETRFERLGVFPFSCEEGTAAQNITEGIVDEEIKSRRADIIMDLQSGIHEQNNQKSVGKTLRVLCEGRDTAASVYFGRSYEDAPEIDGNVFFTSSKKHAAGDFVDVLVQEVVDYDLFGKEI